MDERREREREREREVGEKSSHGWKKREREKEEGREVVTWLEGKKRREEREKQEGREVISWQRDSSCQLATIFELAFLRDSGLDYYSSGLSDCQFVLDDIRSQICETPSLLAYGMCVCECGSSMYSSVREKL